MLFTESIYLIILFTLPAAVHMIFNAYVRFTPRIQRDKSIEMAESVIFSILVFIMSMAVYGKKIKEFAEYLLLSNQDKAIYILNNPKFNYWEFLIEYTKVTFALSVIIIVTWYGILIRSYHYIVNKVNSKYKKHTELRFSDIWRNLFETDIIISKFECCIVLEKGGSMITAGLLHSHQSPHLDEKELLLFDTEQIKEVLKNDTEKSPDKRVFYPALYEYYDANADILMKFYAIDKYKRKHNQTS